MMIDVGPATVRMAQLLALVSDGQLEMPTPCPATTVGALVDHVGTLTVAFTSVARKETVGAPPPPSATNLEDGWRDRIARDLDTLARAWRVSAAWEGMTVAGGIDLPGEVAGLVVLDELLVHGWDIATAIGATSIGRRYEPSPAEVEAAASFVASFDAPRDGNLFGPVVPVPADAAPFDRLLGLTGRDPKWKPTTP